MTTTFSHLDSRSASSFRDGLGERTLVFDRVQVRTLEALHLRPELSAFAGAVTERVSMLESFRHRHYARVRQVTGDPGRLVILSDHVSGVRLSDLIDIVWSAELTLDAGSGLYLISRLLPAAADFHAATGCTHETIAPERLVITPRGKLAIVEPMLAPALAGIGFSRDRLWREMRIGTPISRDRSTFDERTDVAQIALIALSLLLGRALEPSEYPNQIPALLADAALQSRLGLPQPMPVSLHEWFERALSIRSRRGFGTLRDAQRAFDEILAAEFPNGATRGALRRLLAQVAELDESVDAPDEADEPSSEPAPPRATEHRPRPPLAVPNAPLPWSGTDCSAADPPNAPPQPEPDSLLSASLVEPIAELLEQKHADQKRREADRRRRPGDPVRASSPSSDPSQPSAASASAIGFKPQPPRVRPHATGHPPPPAGRDSAVTEQRPAVLGRPPADASASVRRMRRWWGAAAALLIVGTLETGGTSPVRLTRLTADHIARSNESALVDRGAPADTGVLIVTTTPVDARVWVDGQARGSTPVTISGVPPGRHTVVLESGAGTIRRSVRLEPGATVSLSEPIYPGWIAIFAPVRLEIFENGRPIGTTEDGRIMRSPGTYTFDLVSDRLAYRDTVTLKVGPGEVAAHAVELPTGTVTIRAEPWADVSIDGEPVGRTPLETLSLPIGTRTVRFTHPEFGEKRALLTVTLAAPIDLGMTMTP